MSPSDEKTARKRIVFAVTEDWAFLNHRLPMAKAAADAGFEVYVFAREGNRREEIERLGYRFVPAPFKRRSLNPFREAWTTVCLMSLIRRLSADVVQCVALKPIVAGSAAALLIRDAKFVNTFTGLGAVFIDSTRFKLLRRIILGVLRMSGRLEHVYSIVQNEDDLDLLMSRGVINESRTVTIHGSGVDTKTYRPSDEPTGGIRVAMVSRLLWDKGVGEVVEAARLLKARGAAVRITLIGAPDPQNPASIDQATFDKWMAEDVVELAGHRTDIAEIWAETHIGLLASYREGVPKSLLEAAACGRPIIAADVPGCRSIVRHEETGLLVPARDPSALADAIERLASDQALREVLGRNARRFVEERYSDTRVRESMTELYERITE